MEEIEVPPGEPTPEEIQAGCLRIQAKWSAEERERRSCYKSPPVGVQTLADCGTIGVKEAVEQQARDCDSDATK